MPMLSILLDIADILHNLLRVVPQYKRIATKSN
jgi:hypothetical protein